MTLDPTTNFAKTTLDVPAGGYATGDTSISVTDASEFPDPSTDGEYNIVVWDITQGSAADASTREIMRVTGLSTNTFTVTRAQESTSAQTYSETETYRVILAPTAKMFSDIDSGFQPLSSSDNHVESFTGDLNSHLQGIVFADTGHTNSPNGNNGICRAYSLDDDNVIQRFEEIGANVDYWRRKSGGTWQSSPAWNKIVNDGDSPTFGGLEVKTTSQNDIGIFIENSQRRWLAYANEPEDEFSIRDTDAGLNALSIKGGAAIANFLNMPTVGGDAIVESGSNSDGEWVKYADGTMICRFTGTLEYDSAVLLEEVWTFPQPFNNTTTQVSSLIGSSGSFAPTAQEMSTMQASALSATEATIRLIRQIGATDFQAGDSAPVYLKAIGTWK